ncbi:chorismate lyase [Endozoicomonas sp. SM1973]|uniref:Probable chorismate pyruvate-lyase n=1 Tax=Spartinivicinus marinus TaxID=2994442 RepID=A0A853HSW2_9GAMM|nr:chorismate lyase [Spartinivicinus marinus]NYZ64383.1 chorismate lyase [Spartinivicinus marinus]
MSALSIFETAQWQPHLNIPTPWHDWLTFTGSLSQRLQDTFQSLSVKLISQQWQPALLSEQKLLGIPKQQSAFVREVILCACQQPVIYARTVIPAFTGLLSCRPLLSLDTEPLGKLLFTHASSKRNPNFQYAHFSHEQLQTLPIPSTITHSTINQDCWGRQSVFIINQRQLAVSELFLPTIFSLQQLT